VCDVLADIPLDADWWADAWLEPSRGSIAVILAVTSDLVHSPWTYTMDLLDGHALTMLCVWVMIGDHRHAGQSGVWISAAYMHVTDDCLPRSDDITGQGH